MFATVRNCPEITLLIVCACALLATNLGTHTKQRRNEVSMKRICKECGKEFELVPDEIKFYKSKNLALPKRCKECRDKNKAEKRSGSRKKTDNKNVNTIKHEFNGTMQKGQNTRQQAADKEIKNNIQQSSGNLDINHNSNNSYKNGSNSDDTSRNSIGNSSRNNNSSSGNNNSTGRKNKFIIAAILFISIIAALSGRHLLVNDTADGDKSSYENSSNSFVYKFRNDTYLTEHFEKHGREFGYTTKEDYLAGANNVISSSDVLHKTEAEDGDDIYYLEDTNEFVVVSTDGYIRTYFKPEDGLDYYNRQ